VGRDVQPEAREGQAGRRGAAERVTPLEGRGLSSRQTQDVRGTRRLGNLSTPNSLQKLQTALHAKAKAQPGCRFYALYDKISRADIPGPRLCPMPLQLRGAGGGRTGLRRGVEAYWLEHWLGELAAALKEETYRPDPIRCVYIPKANGKLRPLGSGAPPISSVRRAEWRRRSPRRVG
jgi:RNA-directed DNA polymerase